jgi:isoquinoline 1-oxidoreductase beta subunit
MSTVFNPSRRRFLKVGAGAAGGLVIGFHVSGGQRYAAAAAAGAQQSTPFAPNAFLRIDRDDSVTVICSKSEMGQGVYTSLPMLVAEELDANWERVRVEAAPAADVYRHTQWGTQVTGGSSSVSSSWIQFREAGAAARTMLLAAAATQWSVPLAELTTEAGQVRHGPSGRSISYGELASAAAQHSVPESVELKAPRAFRIIGQRTRRLEAPGKVDGTAQFGIDVRLPKMLTAVIARSAVFGGKAKAFDPTPAMAIGGVAKVKQVPSGIAVLASGYWAAKQGRDALRIDWDLGPGADVSTQGLLEDYRKRAQTEGPVAESLGNAEAALNASRTTVEAEFEFPYLAHAAMEPLNCTVHARADGADVWAGTQMQTLDQAAAAGALELDPASVKIHTTLLGGGFGRRAVPTSDFVSEAAHVAKGEDVPVMTIWTREDDTRGGYYRPLFLHRIRAGIDEAGRPTGWHHRIVGQSIVAGTPFSGMIKDGIDHTSVEGVAHMAYTMPARQVELHTTELPVPVLWWRSVGHTHSAFAVESTIDELAHAAARDPVEFRLDLLSEQPRHLAVLRLAAEKAGWGKPLSRGRGRGVAVHASFNSVVAEVAEVTVSQSGELTVDRVVVAVHCGLAVNPLNVENQIQSSIAFGLTAALYGEITLEEGRVQQSNFHDYRLLRLQDMPALEVYIVPSEEPPTGVGEPGVPPIAPAVANAVFAATGKRVRRLPMAHTDLSYA